MHPFLRSVLGVVAGLVAAFVVIILIELVTVAIFPLPPGIDPTDPESLQAAMASISPGNLIGVLVAWVVGTGVGSFVAAKIGAHAPLAHGAIVGALVLCSTVVNMLMVPHPVWLWIGALVLIPLASAAAARRVPRLAA